MIEINHIKTDKNNAYKEMHIGKFIAKLKSC